MKSGKTRIRRIGQMRARGDLLHLYIFLFACLPKVQLFFCGFSHTEGLFFHMLRIPVVQMKLSQPDELYLVKDEMEIRWP